MVVCDWSVAALVGGISTSNSTAPTSRSLAWEDGGDKKENLDRLSFCDGRVLPMWGESEETGCEEEPPGEEEEEGGGGGDHQEGGGGGERVELRGEQRGQ